MAGGSRVIARIAAKLVTDNSEFNKGLRDAGAAGDRFGRDFGKNFGNPFGRATAQLGTFGKGLGDLGKSAAAPLAPLGRVGSSLTTSVLAVARLNAGFNGLRNVRLDNLTSIGGLLSTLSRVATAGFSGIAELGKDAASLGTTVEGLSRLQAVAKASGVDVKDLAAFMRDLTANLHDSIGKTTVAGEALKKLGLSAEALQKMTPEQQIATLNKGFAALPNDAERAAVAMQLAGENGVKMFRMLTMGTTRFQAAFDAAPIVSEADVDSVRKLQIALDKIGDTIAHLAEKFASTLAPKIEAVADMILGLGRKIGPMFGYNPAAAATPAAPTPPAMAARPHPVIAAQAKFDADQARKAQEAAAAAQTSREAAAQAAAATVARLQAKANKQAEGLARKPDRHIGTYSTNRNGFRYGSTQQKDLDKHRQTNEELATARKQAERLAAEAKTPGQAMGDAVRMNRKLLEEVAGLKQEYREQIQTSGQDDVHRRVAAIKGIAPADRKALLAQGYQARESGKTSALRDDLQESTKLPIQRLTEDLDRVARMVALGAANGGLSRRQGILAAAKLTTESGLAGGETRFAGALQANSIEGRSYLLSQTVGRPDDPVTVAKQGLAIAGQGNSILGRILGAITNAPPDRAASF